MTEEKKSIDVMVLMPSHDAKCYVETARSVLLNFADCARHGINLFWQTKLGDSILPRSRNQLLHAAFKHGADYAFFWDSDIVLPYEAIRTLIQSNHELCGIAYPLKSEEMKFAFNARGEFPIINGWAEVQGIGTGAMLISRKAYEKMCDAYPGLLYFDDQMKEQIFRLFDFEVQGNMYIGEDYVFCGRYRHVGGKIMMLTDMDVAHYGHNAWTRCFYNDVAKKVISDGDSTTSDKSSGADDTPEANGSFVDLGGGGGRARDTQPDEAIVANTIPKIHAVA
jgi:hypothetical protein